MKELLMKQVLLLLAILSMAVGASAQNFDFSATAPSGQTLYYKIMDTSTVNVVYPQYANNDYWSGYTKPTGTLTIPSVVTNSGISYTVTSIGAYAFYACSGIETLNMPTSLVSIGNNAFYNCTNINHIIIPEGVATIGEYAFYGVSMAGDISLPNTLITIGQQAFNNINGITELTIPRNVKNIGQRAFNSITSLITLNYNADSCWFPNPNNPSTQHFIAGINSLTQINIGPYVQYIPEYAFYNYAGITSITLPNSVRRVGRYAFANCSGLQTVNFGNGIETIESYAFFGCTSLDTLNFPTSLKEIGESAFYGLTQLQTLTLPSSLEIISQSSFSHCSNLTNLIFNADSCIWNGGNGPSNSVFTQCTHLTTVTFGNNVKCIPGNLLSGTPITTVTIPNSVKAIGSYAFNGTPLQTVHFGNSVETIGAGAFRNCNSLTAINLPNSLKIIKYSAFSGCSIPTSVTIPQNVINIEAGAFGGCTNLDTLFFNADSCLMMGIDLNYSGPYGAFVGQTIGTNEGAHAFDGLKYVHIGSNVKSIPACAFRLDTVLTSIKIPNSVRKIGWGAFVSCTKLNTITFGSNVDTIERYAFYNCTAVDTMPLPSSLIYIGESAFMGMTLQSFTVPENVTYIGDEAFHGPNVRSIRCLPSIPPVLQYHLMSSVNGFNPTQSLAIHVPCNALYSYQHSVRWSSYDNWQLLEGNYSIKISSANSSQGIANYVTTDCEVGSVTIEGIPSTHYRFAHWSDGNTDNPRSLTLTSDTMLSASFEPDTFVVTATSTNQDMGSVLGGGTYFNGDTARVYALSTGGNWFDRWDNGSTDNPRTFVVNSDVTLSASFSLPLHDTTYLWQYDTTYIDNYIHDTTYVDNYIHDTTIVDNWIYDTTYLWQYDTTYIDNYIHDTTYIDNYIHDTTIVDNWIYDTTYLWQYDTTFIDNYIHDTTYVDNYIYDTTYVDNWIYDTTYVTDTLWLTEYDTIWLHDTIIIHDTIYISQEDIADVAGNSAKVYSSRGQIVVAGAEGNTVTLYDALGRQLAMRRNEYGEMRFDVQATGVYFICVGNQPAMRIVAIR